MSQWVRNAVMLVVLSVWAVAVLHTLLVMKTLPDAFTWGVPGGIYYALKTPQPRRPSSRPARGEPST